MKPNEANPGNAALHLASSPHRGGLGRGMQPIPRVNVTKCLTLSHLAQTRRPSSRLTAGLPRMTQDVAGAPFRRRGARKRPADRRLDAAARRAYSRGILWRTRRKGEI